MFPAKVLTLALASLVNAAAIVSPDYYELPQIQRRHLGVCCPPAYVIKAS